MRVLLAWLAVSTAFAGFVALIVALDIRGALPEHRSVGAAKSDQNEHHLPQIAYFVTQPLPTSPYPSTMAATPGHHILLAFVSRWLAGGRVGPEVIPLRVAQVLLALLLIQGAWYLCHLGADAQERSPWRASALILPLACSPYVLSGAVHVTTDDAALGWACLSLVCLASVERAGVATFWGAIFATLAVLWRQNQLWLVAPMMVRAGSGWAVMAGRERVLAAVGLVLPLLAVGYFAILWGGPVPPEFRETHWRGANLVCLGYILALFGTAGPFFCGYVWDEVRRCCQGERRRGTVASLLAGAMVAILVPSTYRFDRERWGGPLWGMTERIPAVGDRSILFLVLVPAGAVFLWWSFRAARRDVAILACALSAWMLTSIANERNFHRYFEPTVLVFLAALAARAPRPAPWAPVGPLVLAGLLLGAYVWTIWPG